MCCPNVDKCWWCFRGIVPEFAEFAGTYDPSASGRATGWFWNPRPRSKPSVFSWQLRAITLRDQHCESRSMVRANWIIWERAGDRGFSWPPTPAPPASGVREISSSSLGGLEKTQESWRSDCELFLLLTLPVLGKFIGSALCCNGPMRGTIGYN